MAAAGNERAGANEMFDTDGTGDFKLKPPMRFTPDDLAGKIESFELLAAPKSAEAAEAPADPETVERQKSRPDASWVRLPAPPPLLASETEIWHYTDAAGVIGVLESQTLWATSLATLNDSAEYGYGRSILDKITARIYESRFVHKLQKSYLKSVIAAADEVWDRGDIFVVCASLSADSLPQWRGYGGQSPHAVRLDARSNYAVVGAESADYEIGDFYTSWSRLLYDREEQESLLLDVLSYIAYSTPAEGESDNLAVSGNLFVLIQALGYLKDVSFASESEVRLMVVAPPGAKSRYRASRYGVARVLEVTGAPRPMRTIANPITLPIVGAAVGPTPTRESSAVSLRRLLDVAGRPGADVQVSASTFR